MQVPSAELGNYVWKVAYARTSHSRLGEMEEQTTDSELQLSSFEDF